jgi:hypothetical protein
MIAAHAGTPGADRLCLSRIRKVSNTRPMLPQPMSTFRSARSHIERSSHVRSCIELLNALTHPAFLSAAGLSDGQSRTKTTTDTYPVSITGRKICVRRTCGCEGRLQLCSPLYAAAMHARECYHVEDTLSPGTTSALYCMALVPVLRSGWGGLHQALPYGYVLHRACEARHGLTALDRRPLRRHCISVMVYATRYALLLVLGIKTCESPSLYDIRHPSIECSVLAICRVFIWMAQIRYSAPLVKLTKRLGTRIALICGQ